MTTRNGGRRAVAHAFALLAGATGVDAQNVDEMAKWTALTVVRYRVVGEFSGETPLFAGGGQNARATDRVELEFDWDQFEMKLAGTAKITNADTEFTPIPIGDCPASRVNGKLEVANAVSVSSDQLPGMLTVTTSSQTPAGANSGPNENGPCAATYDHAAGSATGTTTLQVIPAMMLAMGPPGANGISPDGKSFIVKAQAWTWTYTPTPVR